jgi:hypothetical protein
MATMTSRGKPRKVLKVQVVKKEPSLNSVQKREVKQLASIPKELNAIDTSFLQSIDANGTVTKLLMPAQGDGVSERNGDKIWLKRIRLRFSMIYGDTTNTFRLILFRWTQDNSIPANVPSTLDVLQGLNALQQYNFTHKQANQVHIIYDRTLTLSTNGTPNRVIDQVLYGKRLGKKKIIFDAAITTGTDQIYVLAISDSIAVPHPALAGYVRVEYTD